MAASARGLLIRIPLIGRCVLVVIRLKTALTYFKKPLRELAWWLFRSRETTNFTYDLDPLNRRYLAAFTAHVTNKPEREILGYLADIEADDDLREHIRTLTKRHAQHGLADAAARYGRRIAWYAVVRAVKPRVVVETGVDKGLGACVLTAALQRNHEQGYRGYYFGTDDNPRAGYLLDGRYAEFGRVLHGDSIETLRALDRKIDVFINDSNHSAEYEAGEYQAIRGKLSPRAVILGDNAHVTDALINFAHQTGRAFLFFQEKPHAHWYPGAGIGAAFPGGKGSVVVSCG